MTSMRHMVGRSRPLFHLRGLCDSLETELGLRRTLTKKLAAQRKQPPPPPPQPIMGPVARVSTAQIKEGTAAQLQHAYTTHAKELYRSCPGFLGSVLLLDRKSNTARSVTMWQKSADMAAAAVHPRYSAVMGELAASFADTPDSQTWELAAAFFAQGDMAPEVEPGGHEGDSAQA